MLFETSYKTIEKAGESLYVEKGSKFIGISFFADSEEKVKEILKDLKQHHPKANHICYAFILKPDKSQFRAQDDGEPSGTAGRPILNQIKSFDLTNTLVCVIRYFGGILLGTGGLAKAYRETAFQCLQNSILIQKEIEEIFEVPVSPEQQGSVIPLIKSLEGKYEIKNITADQVTIVGIIQLKNTEKFLSELKKMQIAARYMKTI